LRAAADRRSRAQRSRQGSWCTRIRSRIFMSVRPCRSTSSITRWSGRAHRPSRQANSAGPFCDAPLRGSASPRRPSLTRSRPRVDVGSRRRLVQRGTEIGIRNPVLSSRSSRRVMNARRRTGDRAGALVGHIGCSAISNALPRAYIQSSGACFSRFVLMTIPMLATGGRAVAAIQLLREAGRGADSHCLHRCRSELFERSNNTILTSRSTLLSSIVVLTRHKYNIVPDSVISANRLYVRF